MNKRILIITQYIYPETFKSSEMAFELALRGNKVDVLSGIPNYPEGHYYKGYGIFSKRKEVKNGVTFYRCFQTPRKLLPGFIGLSLNFISFAFNATLWVLLFFAWRKKYDAIITHEPSPITQIIPACVLGKIKGIPVYSWIQDIWPDAVTSTIGAKGKLIEPILQRVTDWIYKNSEKILISSKGMKNLVNRTHDYSGKIIYYPQWAEDMQCDKEAHNNIENIQSNHYTIMMVGSLNSGIGVDAVLSLCEEMKNDPVNFVFVGGGSEEHNMRNFILQHKILNVCFTGRRPSSEMPTYCSQADAMLLSLLATEMPHLRATIPARLQGYLSAGKPVLAMVDGNAAELIVEADCGYAVPAGEYSSLAEYIRNSVITDKETFSKKGINARLYFESNFTKHMCIDKLVKILESK